MRYTILLTFLLLIIFGGLTGCDSWTDNSLDLIHSITVINQTSCVVSVVLDNTDVLELPATGDLGTFDDVPEGVHELVAYREVERGSPEEFTRLTLTVTERKDYLWTLETCDDE